MGRTSEPAGRYRLTGSAHDSPTGVPTHHAWRSPHGPPASWPPAHMTSPRSGPEMVPETHPVDRRATPRPGSATFTGPDPAALGWQQPARRRIGLRNTPRQRGRETKTWPPAGRRSPRTRACPRPRNNRASRENGNPDRHRVGIGGAPPAPVGRTPAGRSHRGTPRIGGQDANTTVTPGSMAEPPTGRRGSPWCSRPMCPPELPGRIGDRC